MSEDKAREYLPIVKGDKVSIRLCGDGLFDLCINDGTPVSVSSSLLSRALEMMANCEVPTEE